MRKFSYIVLSLKTNAIAMQKEKCYIVVAKKYLFGCMSEEHFLGEEKLFYVSLLADSTLLGSPYVIFPGGAVTVAKEQIRLANRQDFANFRVNPESYRNPCPYGMTEWIFDDTPMEVLPFPDGIFKITDKCF